MGRNDEKSLKDLVAMLRKQRTAMMTTIDDGRMVSRPMGLQAVDNDATLWFLTTIQSDKVEQVLADPRVNLAFTHSDQLSVSGTAHVVDDVAKKTELWDPSVRAFMSTTPEDPSVVLIRVDAESIGYWDSPSAAGVLLQVAKGMATGERPEPGTAGVVEV